MKKDESKGSTKDESKGSIFVMSNSDLSIAKILFRKSQEESKQGKFNAKDCDKYFAKAREDARSCIKEDGMQKLGFSLSLAYKVDSYDTVSVFLRGKIANRCLSADDSKGEYLYALDAREIADILAGEESKHCCNMVFPPSAGSKKVDINRWVELGFRENKKTGYARAFIALLVFIAIIIAARFMVPSDWPISETVQLCLVLTAIFLPIWLTLSINFASKAMVIASGSESSQGKSKISKLLKRLNKWEAKHHKASIAIAIILIIGALLSAEIFITFSDTLLNILFNINPPDDTSTGPNNLLHVISAIIA